MNQGTFQIGAAGMNYYGFCVGLSANFNFSTADAILPFDTIVWDYGNIWNPQTFKGIITRPGLYQCQFSILQIATMRPLIMMISSNLPSPQNAPSSFVAARGGWARRLFSSRQSSGAPDMVEGNQILLVENAPVEFQIGLVSNGIGQGNGTISSGIAGDLRTSFTMLLLPPYGGT